MLRHVRLVAGAAVVAIVLSDSLVAGDRDILQLRGWIDAVERHAAGQSDEALGVVTAWSYADLERMRPYIEALVEAPTQDNAARVRRRRNGGVETGAVGELTRSLLVRGDVDDFKRRAVLLHTDAAILGSAPLIVAPPTKIERRYSRQAARRTDVKSFDGQTAHFELQNLHWELAMDVLDALPAKPARDPMVGQWYRAVGAHFAREHRFADAQRHFDRARGLVPDDPGVLYGAACLQETLGAPPVQDYVRVTTLPHGLVIVGVESPLAHLRRAETLLRRSLAADPSSVEASLRLGRVLAGQEKHDEALTHLQTAQQSDDRTTAYYGHLFAGDATQALGRLEDARRHYEQAIALFSESQAARLALGSVLRSTGDRAAALTAIDTMLRTPSRGPDDDPWWEYYDGDAAQVDRLLEALRAPFTRPR